MSIPRLSVPPSATAMQPPRPAAAAGPGMAKAAAQAGSIGAPPLSGPRFAAAAPPVLPAWPDPAAVNLAAELLALSTTTIATTATFTLPETGSDFWSMLATALPQAERE